jgi:hypothetical protein
MRKFILAGAAVLAMAGSASARCHYENGARVCIYNPPNGNLITTRTTDETRKTIVMRPDGSTDVTTEPIDYGEDYE